MTVQRFNALAKPTGLVCKTVCAANLLQRAITFNDVEADTPLQFAQADRAEMEGTPNAFGEMIRTVHEAIEKRAVSQPEHVTGLVREDFAAPAQ